MIVQKKIKVDAEQTRKAYLRIRAINHKLRQTILADLQEYGTMSVTEIYCKNRIEQSVASQHLAILRRAGLVKTQRDGKTVHYSVSNKALQSLTDKCSEIARGN